MAKSKIVEEKEKKYAALGYRYWGTAKYEDDYRIKGEVIMRVVDVLDRPGDHSEDAVKLFYFADVEVIPEKVKDKKVELRRDGQPFSVGSGQQLDPAIREQLVNVEKIRQGWNPCK